MEIKVSPAGCFQNTGRWICYSIFSDISFIVLFTRLLPKEKVYGETILFQLKFQKPILRCSILQKIKMWNFVILKWGWFSEIKNADILNFSRIKQFGNYASFLIKWHLWVCYCWNYGSLNLKAEQETGFWWQTGMANCQDMVLDSCLRQIASSQVTSFWCF